MQTPEDGPHPQHENAVSLWRAGEKLSRQRRTDDWQRDYDAAIAAAGVVLHRYHTMDALITAYFDDAVDEWVENRYAGCPVAGC